MSAEPTLPFLVPPLPTTFAISEPTPNSFDCVYQCMARLGCSFTDLKVEEKINRFIKTSVYLNKQIGYLVECKEHAIINGSDLTQVSIPNEPVLTKRIRAIFEKFYREKKLNLPTYIETEVEKLEQFQIENIHQLFRDLHFDVQKEFEKDRLKDAKMPLEPCRAIYENYAKQAVGEALGLKVLDWDPSKESIADLKQKINSNGPLIVGGFFGDEMYKVGPSEVDKINGRSIFGWRPEERILEKERMKESLPGAHDIIIIGVDILKENVYWINGFDRSPVDQTTVYAMSYTRLAEDIINIKGVPIKSKPAHCEFAMYWHKRSAVKAGAVPGHRHNKS